MAGTKEKILCTALRLFAQYGYEAVSVSVIAGELGITKGALYKHYKNKRDIFDSIVERMCRMDVGRARKYEVPEEVFEKQPQAYRNTAVGRIREFAEAQFRFWTTDEFARDFRRMLVLEQYGNPEMAALYQKILAGGPVSYLEDLFRELMGQGTLKKADPRLLAVEFHAPFYLLMSLADAAADDMEKVEAAKLLTTHLEQFMERNATARGGVFL